MFLLRVKKWLLPLLFPARTRRKLAELGPPGVCLLNERIIRCVFPGLKIRKQGDGKWIVRTQDSLIPYMFFCTIAPAGKSSIRCTATHMITSIPVKGKGYTLKLIEYLDPQGVKMGSGGKDELRSARICSVSAEQEFCLVDFYKPNA